LKRYNEGPIKTITVPEYMKPWLDPFEANVLSGVRILSVVIRIRSILLHCSPY